jgi:hypothetical protein
MTEPTRDGQVREVFYGPGGRREYERVLSPPVAFDKAIALIVAALKAVGRDEAADAIWSRQLDSQEVNDDQIPDLSVIFGGLR